MLLTYSPRASATTRKNLSYSIASFSDTLTSVSIMKFQIRLSYGFHKIIAFFKAYIVYKIFL